MKFVARSKKEALDKFLSVVPTWEGKPYTVSITEFKRPRTNPQNRKMHAMIRDLSAHTGYPERMMKDICKARFGPMQDIVIGEKTETIPKSTAEYSVDELSNFIEHLFMLGAEIDCIFTDE